MLEVSTETICFFIDKAREFHAKEEVVIPEDVPDSPADDWGRQVLADHVGDATYEEFKSTFEDLEPDQQTHVVALFWTGRGDFDVAEWEDAVDQARDSWTTETAEYLMAHPMLADHLMEGLAMLGYDCE